MKLKKSHQSIDLQSRFLKAIQFYWTTRSKQQNKQINKGVVNDAGLRSSVTGGAQMLALEQLVSDVLIEAGIPKDAIQTGTKLELPGYFRSEKKWDLVVVSEGQLVAAMEFKSQAGPSFGNNFNNRTEEAIGSAKDILTAYREGRLGKRDGFRPLLAYFFLLEDCEQVRKPVKNAEPHFEVEIDFKNASYARRYELLCKRLVREQLYDVACLTLATKSAKTIIEHPSSDVSFHHFITTVRSQATKWLSLIEQEEKNNI